MKKQTRTRSLSGLLPLLLAALLLITMAVSAQETQPVAVVVATQPDGTAYETVVAAALAEAGTPHAYPTLEAALGAAQSGQTVVLVADAAMQKSAVVPAGVMLLLPCENTYKAYELNGFGPDGGAQPPNTGMNGTRYRSLRIPESVTLTVSGKLLVNAVTGRSQSGHYDMDINGGYAEILLDGALNLSAGATMESMGLVTGGGSVHAKTGSNLFELYVVRHWRGGSQAFEMVVNADVFPMNEIDSHNIQTTLRIDYGATYAGTVKMFAGGGYNHTRFPQIDNANGLIRLNSGGYAVKTYDAAAKRATIDLYGGGRASRSTLNIVGLDLSTGDYLYPLDGDITIGLHSGSYQITENFKAMPGFVLRVGGDASLRVNEGKRLVCYDVFLDKDNTSTTEYPADRPPACVALDAGADMTVSGGFAGQIQSDAGGTVAARVHFDSGATLGAITYEANGYRPNQTTTSENPVAVALHFAALLKGAAEDGNHPPLAGNSYFYLNGWHGGDIPAGEGTATLSGTMALQGRTSHDGAVVTLTGGKDYTTLTSADGTYAFTGVETGIYTLQIRQDGYLRYTKAGISVLDGAALGVPPITLYGGDLNDSGRVDITDYNLLLGNYQGSGMGDINGSGRVDISDYNLLLGNYQKQAVNE